MTAPSASQPLTLRQRIGRFFYEEEVPYGLALVRILVPLAILAAMLPRWPHARELYSTDGASTPLWLLYGYATMLPEVPGGVAVAMHTLLVFFLVASCLGWHTRLSLIGATVLYTHLNLLDTISTMTKYSVIATHALLLLSLSHCGAVWSVDRWRRGRSGAWPGASGGGHLRAPVWPRRLMQLMIGLVYFGAAITKLHTPPYFSGEQLMFWMVTQINRGHALGEYLTLYPTLLVVFAYLALLWEMLFVFLVWRGPGRPLMLGLGIVFHLMTLFTLGLLVFPLVCFSIYFAFLSERDVQAVAAVVRRVRRRFGLRRRLAAAVPETIGWGARRPWLSPAAFAGLLPLLAVAGVGIEHWRDPYGVRRPEGPHALRVLEPSDVRAMLAPSHSIRDEDKIFGLDIGTTLVGGRVFDRQTVFRQGDELVAQVILNPPYEDLWLECDLHDADDHLVARAGGVALRETFRNTFSHALPHSLAPGQYSVVVSVAGNEVLRRTITLQPGAQAALGN